MSATTVASLEPRIAHILNTPGIDLSTISAKRVRKQLLLADPTLDTEWVHEHKQEIDELIGVIFEGITEARDDDDDVNNNRKRTMQPGSSSPVKAEHHPPPPLKPKVKKETHVSDEDYARQLQAQMNSSRESRSGKAIKSSSSSSRKKNGSGKRKETKSAATIEDSDASSDSDSDRGKTSKAKRRIKEESSSRKGGTGFMKEFALSAPLAALLDTPQLSRPLVVKQLWVYIKAHELQKNPSNRKQIFCDEAMKAVFNKDKMDMFEMSKLLSAHLHEIE